MSSKQPTYPRITRNNYEEFFLLYVDGELAPEAMDTVDAFAALHPDLQEELQHLLDTRLEAEPLALGDLAFLQADQMRRLTREEELLCYLDNELDAAGRAALDRDLAADPALRAELEAFRAAQLPAELVPCPFKEELYRRSEKRRPLVWLPRIAAAVLLLGAGTWLWQHPGARPATPGNEGVAVVTPKQQAPAPGPVASPAPAPAAVTAPADLAQVVPVRTTTPKHDRISTDRVAVKEAPPAAKDRGVPAPADQKEVIAYNYTPDERDRTPIPRDHGTLPAGDGGDTHSVNPSLGTSAVTSPAVAALHNQNSDAQPAATEAVYREEGRQNSVRGLLRKATRFLEKRTGIKATNENNELVVGGVAFNLK